MSPWQIIRPSFERICCKRSYSTSLPLWQNGRGRSAAAAFLDEIAPSQNRSLPLSPSPYNSPGAPRTTSHTQPSKTPTNDSSAQSDPLARTYSPPKFTSSAQSPPPDTQSSPSLTSTQAPTAKNLLAQDLLLMQSGFTSPKDNSFSLKEAPQRLQNQGTQADFAQQMHRRWSKGDVYAPRDLGATEMKKWRVRSVTPKRDVFDELGIDPRKEYKNFALLGEFMTETGRIKHSSVTGLRPRNQRRIAKAIRRAIGIGIMPSVHKHPELLARSRGR